VALVTISIAAVGAVVVFWVYSTELQVIRDRLTTGSQVVQTQHGPIEYRMWGEGAPVLVVHGAGGGYDLGVLQAITFGGEGFKWISPSRFGYLRTPMPEDASTVAQADAYAELLDALGIERVAILAMSGGVPSSLQFAIRYPERTSALALLSSAPYTPVTVAQHELPVPIWVYQALFGSDFPYWMLQRAARPSLEQLFDVTPTLRAELTPPERALVDSMVDGFQPVTQRVHGVRNEGAALDPGVRYPMEAITAPTLVVHAIDDHINPFGIGEYTAAHIGGAQLLPLEAGGHLLLGHHTEVRERVNDFLQQAATVVR
jgi:pimeloyl-ACP methyl ester carboxylesterase